MHSLRFFCFVASLSLSSLLPSPSSLAFMQVICARRSDEGEKGAMDSAGVPLGEGGEDFACGLCACTYICMDAYLLLSAIYHRANRACVVSFSRLSFLYPWTSSSSVFVCSVWSSSLCVSLRVRGHVCVCVCLPPPSHTSFFPQREREGGSLAPSLNYLVLLYIFTCSVSVLFSGQPPSRPCFCLSTLHRRCLRRRLLQKMENQPLSLVDPMNQAHGVRGHQKESNVDQPYSTDPGVRGEEGNLADATALCPHTRRDTGVSASSRSLHLSLSPSPSLVD